MSSHLRAYLIMSERRPDVTDSGAMERPAKTPKTFDNSPQWDFDLSEPSEKPVAIHPLIPSSLAEMPVSLAILFTPPNDNPNDNQAEIEKKKDACEEVAEEASKNLILWTRRSTSLFSAQGAPVTNESIPVSGRVQTARRSGIVRRFVAWIRRRFTRGNNMAGDAQVAEVDFDENDEENEQMKDRFSAIWVLKTKPNVSYGSLYKILWRGPDGAYYVGWHTLSSAISYDRVNAPRMIAEFYF